MAIKIQGTTVINDSRELQNIATLDATTYSTIQAAVGGLDNRIINGAFDFWQRGTSSTSFGYAAADRWFNNVNGGTVTMSRQSHTVGDKFGANSPRFYLRQTVSGQSGTASARIRQSIEGVRSYAGETITVLGWVRRSSGSGNMLVRVFQDFGTGGSPSAVVDTAQELVTLSGSWTPFAVPISVPSITGKTLGSDGNDRLVLDITTSGSTDSIGIQTIGVDLWGIHIKRGTHTADATEAYRAPELGPELARCQRYYQRPISTVAFVAASGGDQVQASGPMFSEMRAAPSISAISVGLASNSSRTLVVDGREGWRHAVTSAAPGNTQDLVLLVALDAEL